MNGYHKVDLSPIEIVSIFGLSKHLKILLKDKEINSYKDALSAAAVGEHTEVFNLLLDISNIENHFPENLLSDIMRWDSPDKMVSRLLAFERIKQQADSYIFFTAVKKGMHYVVKALLEIEAVRNEVDVHENRAFRKSVENRDDEIAALLLNYPKVFAYAEQHYQEDGFDKLLADCMQPIIFSSRLGNASFLNLDTEKKHLCFYILRHLIRRNNYLDKNNFISLLSKPAIRELAHLAITPDKPNELLNLAIAVNNDYAQAALLEIPAVRQLAEESARIEELIAVEETLDLREIAENQESSLRALSTEEKKCLQSAIDFYQPQIEQAVTAALANEDEEFIIIQKQRIKKSITWEAFNSMPDLRRKEVISRMGLEACREQLRQRYHANPATIIIDEKKIVLPLEWNDFIKLNLDETQKESALNAYYSHKDHTALRYLSKPNDWMSKHAFYQKSEGNQRWSYFESYQELIVILWLAATDETIGTIEKFDSKSRLAHFIDELFHIGRGHNWDGHRNKIDKEGKLIIIDGKIVTEQFDDGLADNPRCLSGTNSCLFQSVPYHPLLSTLTLEMIKQELRDYVRSHFKSLIHEDNKDVLRLSWQIYIRELEIPESFKQFDLSLEKQTELFNYLSRKYGKQFDESISFKKYLTNRFKLTHDVETHLINFAGEANFEQLLESPPPTLTFLQRFYGFFVTPDILQNNNDEQVDECRIC